MNPFGAASFHIIHFGNKPSFSNLVLLNLVAFSAGHIYLLPAILVLRRFVKGQFSQAQPKLRASQTLFSVLAVCFSFNRVRRTEMPHNYVLTDHSPPLPLWYFTDGVEKVAVGMVTIELILMIALVNRSEFNKNKIAFVIHCIL